MPEQSIPAVLARARALLAELEQVTVSASAVRDSRPDVCLVRAVRNLHEADAALTVACWYLALMPEEEGITR